jgi:multidrug efflux pump subunit AcrA (membrane-fusion protein)
VVRADARAWAALRGRRAAGACAVGPRVRADRTQSEGSAHGRRAPSTTSTSGTERTLVVPPLPFRPAPRSSVSRSQLPMHPRAARAARADTRRRPRPTPAAGPASAPRRPRLLASLAVAALVAAACSGDDGPELAFAEVAAAEVVQTIAAGAQLEPASRVTVTAPVGGEVVELLVGDGDVVQAGQPVAVLASDGLEAQLAQAEAAVDAADALAAAAAGAGLDLSPVLGGFRAQLDAVVPPLLGAVSDQLDAVQAALEGIQQPDVPPTVELDLGGIELPAPELPDDIELPEGVDLPDGIDPPPPITLPDVTVEVPVPQGPTIDMSGALASIRDARARIAEAERGYRDASTQLRAAEADVGAQADQAAAGQAAAVAAQREQAERALDAARGRLDDLTVLAPADGVVELARGGGAGAGANGLGGLDALAGSLGGGGDLGDLGALGEAFGGGGGDAGGGTTSGPIAEGVSVGVGQALLTIYDLSGFTASVDVDEIDVVEVEEGQTAVVLVDAFPDAELEGIVRHVALAPVAGVGGGTIYPVTVELFRVPEEVRLRVGLTASAEIEVRRVDAETTVPTSALLRRGGDEVVHVVREGRAIEVPVVVTALGDDTAAVEGDLRVGETVVTTGVEQLADGDEVDLP